MPQNYLLRAEGVNLSAVLEDTNQLSVIRGSSLMLSDSVKCLLPHLSARFKDILFSEISRDASAVIIKFSSLETIATLVVKEAVQFFCDQYKDFTFVVDSISATNDFIEDQHRLLAKNRLRQLQQPTLAVPEWNTANTTVAVCEVDGIRPSGSNKITGSTITSDSVFRRFSVGRDKRSAFYKDELGDVVDFDTLMFTSDLQALAKSHQHGNLNNKIAVIYWDGNGFGSMQSRLVKTAEEKTAFDDEITQKHRAFLKQQILDSLKNKDYLTHNGELRLETLLWGGDEILMVVPACCGFDTLLRFYQAIENWTYRGEKMTYSCGLVFSQANTPIYRLTKLAKDLAETNKQDPQLKTHNRLDYLVLESMDFPSEPLDVLRQRQYQLAAESRQNLQPLNATGLSTLAHALIESDFPKSKLVELVKAYVADGEEAAQVVENRIAHVIGEAQMTRVTQHIAQLFQQDDPFWNWLHLAELWDYLLPWGDRND